MWISKKKFEEFVYEIQSALTLQAESMQYAVKQLERQYNDVRADAQEWSKAYNRSATEREFLTYRVNGVPYNERDRYSRLEQEFVPSSQDDDIYGIDDDWDY